MWVRFGEAIAAAAAIGALAGFLWLAVTLGAWGWSIVGVIVALIVYALVRGFAELVRLVTDMLLPKEHI